MLWSTKSQIITIIQLLTHKDLSLLWVDKSLRLLKFKSITILLYDFSFENEKFATFIFVVKDMFNFQSKTSKDFFTSFSMKVFNLSVGR